MVDGENDKVLITRCYHLQELITKLDEAILEQKTRSAERKDSTKHKSVTEGSQINFDNTYNLVIDIALFCCFFKQAKCQYCGIY